MPLAEVLAAQAAPALQITMLCSKTEPELWFGTPGAAFPELAENSATPCRVVKPRSQRLPLVTTLTPPFCSTIAELLRKDAVGAPAVGGPQTLPVIVRLDALSS